MISILLIDDQEIVRFAVGRILKDQPEFTLAGTAASASDALSLAAQLKPQIILTETVTADLNSIEIAPRLLEASPASRIIALSARADETIVCDAMKARFAGFVLKKCPFNVLVDAIRAVAGGQMFLCPEVVGAVVANSTQQSQTATHATIGHTARITDREREVLQLISEGYSTKQVADQLSLSLKTVETHRRRVMAKLKIFSIAQLTKYAIREGLTSV